ncbi:hypothetical protein G6F55_008352 [Rhizopus delemar]|uniref:Uncharacterized protein n=3 Tax=Rhizopus TaxID=4842 RepID=I1CE99_RHIO9|nr:hypothetical protein RO3G_11490 [Rhizopus delemar RA 99-880]KAG1453039.1 hypothetical protein G6F55_008352 [Rhizopus delemar]KAG1490592.1 hypothetical protein G6F54_010615 [Rhizopus delemar]KAG1504053.1 hypothetical protein G6F53_010483 [Rhizopus delemar]KAG1623596.1 hypothetical protein G6F45_010825 [Rhizopus arrhizus]|eukprot:EIE86779.1 hypothetical protein RO3G_11490 [Rhizopus delemar RA 99-880]
MVRLLFTTLMVSLFGIAVTLPLEQAAADSSSVDFQHPSYNTQGLPSDIFPDYSGIELEDKEPLKDGLIYLEKQGSGEKLPN